MHVVLNWDVWRSHIGVKFRCPQTFGHERIQSAIYKFRQIIKLPHILKTNTHAVHPCSAANRGMFGIHLKGRENRWKETERVRRVLCSSSSSFGVQSSTSFIISWQDASPTHRGEWFHLSVSDNETELWLCSWSNAACYLVRWYVNLFDHVHLCQWKEFKKHGSDNIFWLRWNE